MNRSTCWRAFGLVVSIISLYSCSNSNSPDAAVSKKPQSLIAKAGSRTVELSWAGVNGADKYTIYWSNNSHFTIKQSAAIFSDIPHFVHGGLNNGTTYYYAVSATVNNTESALSNEVSATPKTPPPSVPNPLRLKAEDQRINVDFDLVDGVSNYQLIWSRSANVLTNPHYVNFVYPHYIHTNLENGQPYYYLLRAINQEGQFSDSVIASASPMPALPLSPVIESASAGDGYITIQWSNTSGAAENTVYWSNFDDINDSSASLNKIGNPFTHAPISNTPNKHYYYRIKSSNATGNSGFSNLLHLITPNTIEISNPGNVPATPVLFDAQQNPLFTALPADSQITLDWPTNADAVAFNLYWKKGGTQLTSELLDKTVNHGVIRNIKPPYTHIGLQNNIYYYYRLSAINNSGESDLSALPIVAAKPEIISPGVPSGIDVISGDKQLTVVWNPVIRADSYTLSLSNAANVKTAFSNVISPFVINGLNNGETYSISLSAISLGQVGSESQAVRATPHVAVPFAPENVYVTSEDSSVTLYWDSALPQDAINPVEAAISGYRVYVSNNADLTQNNSAALNSTPQFDASLNKWKIHIPQLTNGLRYYFIVTALNSGGESNPSAAVWSIPKVSVPGAPQQTIAVAGNNQIEIRFSPGSAADSTTIYNLYWYKYVNNVKSLTQVINSIASPYVFSDGNSNGNTYYFQISASNAGGESILSNTFSATPQVPPPQTAPQNFTLVSADARVSLSWEAVANATGYKLYWANDAAVNVATSSSINLSAGQTQYDHANLINGRNYYYRIAAVNAGGFGPASAVISAVPNIDPPTVPQSPALIAGDASVTVNWSNAVDLAQQIQSYTLQWRVAGAAWQNILGVESGYIQNGLSNGQIYEFRLIAVNAGGNSDASTIASATPFLSVPKSPHNISLAAGDSQILINWQVDSGSSYRLYWAIAPQEPLNGTMLDNVLPEYLHSTLTNGSTYNYRLVAYNTSGNSLESPIFSATAQATAPNAPSGLAAESGNRENRLTWIAPDNAVSTTTYTLYWGNDVNTSPNLAIQNVSPPYIHSGLTNGTYYVYRIAASNAGVEGPSSNITQSIPNPPLPAAPSGLVANAGDRQISLTWSPVSQATSYDIVWSQSGLFDDTPLTPTNVGTNSFLHTNLSNDVTLHYRLYAKNSAGVSDPSSVASATPRSSNPVSNSPPQALNVSISNSNGSTIGIGSQLEASYTYFDVDGDVEGNSQLQWFRNSTPITGATTVNYTVTAADANQTLVFQIIPAALSGVSPGVAARASIVLSNSPPLASNLSITDNNGGTVQVNDSLTATYSYSDIDGDIEGASQYQWFRGTTAISGATNLNYTVVAADSGQSLRFQVTPVAASGTSPGIAASVSIAVVNSVPVVSSISINDINGGQVLVGDVLGGSYIYSDVDGDAEGSSILQWYRGNTAIAGATSATYTISSADANQSLRYQVTPVAVSGASPGLSASATIALNNSAPVASNVVITDNNGGQVVVGDTLTASYLYSDIDGDSEGNSQYQWYRGSTAINGATRLNYTIVSADANQTLRFDVIPVALSGSSPGAAASSTVAVVNSVPVATNVSITDSNAGQVVVGDVLIGNYTYSDVDGDVEGNSVFQWFRGSSPISGATNVSYTVAVADANQTLVFQVTPIASSGANPGVAVSASIGLSNSPPVATNVSITDNNGGQVVVGDTLTASYTYSDIDGDSQGVSLYQWFRGSTAISGATTLNYTINAADANQILRFEVTPVATSGTSPGSVAFTSVTVINSVPIASNVSINDNNGGQVLVGDLLTASYTYSDVDGDAQGVSQFQWYRGSTPISGATALTYTVVAADSNQNLRFDVIPVALSGASPGLAVSASVTVVNSVPVASNVLITDNNGGQIVIGDVLTGSYSYGDLDGDAEGNSTFQWFRGTTAIAGATSTTYTVSTSDANQTLVFQVTPVALSGASPGLTVSASLTLNNSAPVASSVSISDSNGGQVVVGDTLTASYTYSDIDGDLEGASQYQWYRGTSAIAGATALTYTLVVADANQTLRFDIVPVAASGTSPGVVASASIVVINSVPVANNVSVLDNNGGQTVVGDVLSGQYVYSDVDGDTEGASAYQWYRGTTTISGATSINYTVVSADANQTLRFDVTPVATSGASPGVIASASIVIVNSVPVANNVNLTDNNGGLLLVGDSITATYSYNDVDGDAEGASQYQWYRGTTAISGATALSYTTVTADAGQTLQFQVIPVAASGASPGVAANANISLSNSAPVASVVTITDNNSGDTVVGDSLTASYTYSDVDGDAEGVSLYQWYRNSVAITGATGLNYTVVTADANQTLRFEVTPVALTGTSPGNIAVASINIVNSVPTASNVAITDNNGGVAVVGDVLSGSYLFQDIDGDTEGASLLQWYRGTTPINGATLSDYTVTTADANQTLYFEVIPIAATGSNPGLAVSANITIVNSPPQAISVAIVDNNGSSPNINDVLTGSYSYSDIDGDTEGASTFQWFRNNIAIAGATSLNYTATSSDAAQALTFQVTPVAVTGVSPGTPVVSSGITINSVPVAANVSITDGNGGNVEINDVLTGNYNFIDVDNDSEGASTYLWYRNDIIIAGATGRTYTVVSADAGQNLRFGVTPIAAAGSNPGIIALSPIVNVVAAPTGIAQNFIGITNQQLVSIDGLTGKVAVKSSIGNQGLVDIKQIDYDYVDKLIYGINILPTNSSTSAAHPQIASIDPLTGVKKIVGYPDLAFANSVGIAVDPTLKIIYSINGDGKLYSYNIVTHQSQQIGQVSVAGRTSVAVVGLALDVLGSGNLYAILKADTATPLAPTQLLSITTDGIASVIADITSNISAPKIVFSSPISLTFDHNTRQLLAVYPVSDSSVGDYKELINLDPTTAVATSLGGFTRGGGGGINDLQSYSFAYDPTSPNNNTLFVLQRGGTYHTVTLGKINLPMYGGMNVQTIPFPFHNLTAIAYDGLSNTLYGLDTRSRSVLSYNSGIVTKVGQVNILEDIVALAFNPASPNSLYAASATQLYLIDKTNWTATRYGSPLGIYIQDLAVDPSANGGAGQLYAINNTGNQLFAVDSNTGKAINPVVLSLSGIKGIDFAFVGGSYILTGLSSTRHIYTIDTLSGVATDIAPSLSLSSNYINIAINGDLLFTTYLGSLHQVNLSGLVPTTYTDSVISTYDLNSVSGFTFDSDIGIFYVLAPNASTHYLYTINPDSGDTTLVGRVGTSTYEDIAYDPSTGLLFGKTYSSSSLKYLYSIRTSGTEPFESFVGSLNYSDTSVFGNYLNSLAFDSVGELYTMYGTATSPTVVVKFSITKDAGNLPIGVSSPGVFVSRLPNTAGYLTYNPGNDNFIATGTNSNRKANVSSISKSGISTSLVELNSRKLVFDARNNTYYMLGINGVDPDKHTELTTTNLFSIGTYYESAIAYDDSLSQLFTIDHDTGNLLSISPTSGDSRIIGFTEFNDITAMVYVPQNPIDQRLIAYDRKTGAFIAISSTTGSATIKSFITATVSDLAIDTSGGRNALYASDGKNIIPVDPATYTLGTPIPLVDATGAQFSFYGTDGLAVDSLGVGYSTYRPANNNRYLLKINLATGLVTDTQLQTGFDIGYKNIAISKNSGLIYGFDNNTLVSFDRNTGAGTSHGNFSTAYNQLVYSPSDTTYYISFNSNDRFLYALNPLNGDVRFINGAYANAIPLYSGLAVNPISTTFYSNGALYGNGNASLSIFDKTSSLGIVPILINGASIGMSGLSWNSKTSTLFGISAYDRTLFSITDLTNATGTLIGTPFGTATSSFNGLVHSTANNAFVTIENENSLLVINDADGSEIGRIPLSGDSTNLATFAIGQ